MLLKALLLKATYRALVLAAHCRWCSQAGSQNLGLIEKAFAPLTNWKTKCGSKVLRVTLILYSYIQQVLKLFILDVSWFRNCALADFSHVKHARQSSTQLNPSLHVFTHMALTSQISREVHHPCRKKVAAYKSSPKVQFNWNNVVFRLPHLFCIFPF